MGEWKPESRSSYEALGRGTEGELAVFVFRDAVEVILLVVRAPPG